MSVICANAAAHKEVMDAFQRCRQYEGERKLSSKEEWKKTFNRQSDSQYYQGWISLGTGAAAFICFAGGAAFATDDLARQLFGADASAHALRETLSNIGQTAIPQTGNFLLKRSDGNLAVITYAIQAHKIDLDTAKEEENQQHNMFLQAFKANNEMMSGCRTLYTIQVR